MTHVRPARPEDAAAMADVQNAIHRAGLRASPVDVELVRERYFGAEYSVTCTVAEDGDRVIGFQSLKRAWPGNPHGVPEGWGVIGTHVHPEAGRSGIGRRLFAVSLAAARRAGLPHIDASIGTGNPGAVAYYTPMGFVPYGARVDALPHRFDVT